MSSCLVYLLRVVCKDGEEERAKKMTAKPAVSNLVLSVFVFFLAWYLIHFLVGRLFKGFSSISHQENYLTPFFPRSAGVKHGSDSARCLLKFFSRAFCLLLTLSVGALIVPLYLRVFYGD